MRARRTVKHQQKKEEFYQIIGKCLVYTPYGSVHLEREKRRLIW